ncbi:MAG: EVE domain-containing protein [Fimbriiglobus sp.]
MAHWLLKQEPEEFSFALLQEAGATLWDGVSNPLALKHLRSMNAGDSAFFYHTGKEKAIVGIVTIESAAVDEDNVPQVMVLAKKAVKTPVTLATIKADEQFAEWELVKQARLSVMPVTPVIWKAIVKLAG